MPVFLLALGEPGERRFSLASGDPHRLAGRFAVQGPAYVLRHKFLQPDFANSPELNPPAGAPVAEFVPPCPPDVVEIYNKIWTNLRK